ncbi:MAG: hypothetical protein ACYSW6_11410, partial [Planctomycetota bacterium]
GTSLRDETDTGGATFGQTGLISWSPPAATVEHPKTEFGTYGYFYQLTVGTTLHTAVKVDIVTGIPAQLNVKPYKFVSAYKNRLMLGGYTAGKEGNRVDYSLPRCIQRCGKLNGRCSKPIFRWK